MGLADMIVCYTRTECRLKNSQIPEISNSRQADQANWPGLGDVAGNLVGVSPVTG